MKTNRVFEQVLIGIIVALAGGIFNKAVEISTSVSQIISLMPTLSERLDIVEMKVEMCVMKPKEGQYPWTEPKRKHL